MGEGIITHDRPRSGAFASKPASRYASRLIISYCAGQRDAPLGLSPLTNNKEDPCNYCSREIHFGPALVPRSCALLFEGVPESIRFVQCNSGRWHPVPLERNSNHYCV